MFILGHQLTNQQIKTTQRAIKFPSQSNPFGDVPKPAPSFFLASLGPLAALARRRLTSTRRIDKRTRGIFLDGGLPQLGVLGQ